MTSAQDPEAAWQAGAQAEAEAALTDLPALIGAWRTAWGATPGTTDPVAPFGIVQLADSTDEGWGCNVPQMHWAQTANVGFAPNAHLPRTFLAAAHDLACMLSSSTCSLIGYKRTPCRFSKTTVVILRPLEPYWDASRCPPSPSRSVVVVTE